MRLWWAATSGRTGVPRGRPARGGPVRGGVRTSARISSWQYHDVPSRSPSSSAGTTNSTANPVVVTHTRGARHRPETRCPAFPGTESATPVAWAPQWHGEIHDAQCRHWASVVGKIRRRGACVGAPRGRPACRSVARSPVVVVVAATVAGVCPASPVSGSRPRSRGTETPGA